jgi:hypothetical protein
VHPWVRTASSRGTADCCEQVVQLSTGNELAPAFGSDPPVMYQVSCVYTPIYSFKAGGLPL